MQVLKTSSSQVMVHWISAHRRLKHPSKQRSDGVSLRMRFRYATKWRINNGPRRDGSSIENSLGSSPTRILRASLKRTWIRALRSNTTMESLQGMWLMRSFRLLLDSQRILYHSRDSMKALKSRTALPNFKALSRSRQGRIMWLPYQQTSLQC